ncbi:profilin, required for normal timing of actin polymerization in response to thermal stress [Tulasnella sp. JGI-2019a]|nr:profilin, required for normal timing of actin polymerization in response to thermal stress [Tulasnella sp. JGI-2019a]KAG8984514.1 profilin, required for normal timing of actin polymerization in response to thermal stress [Tulasnella sp. JGI-2019a]
MSWQEYVDNNLVGSGKVTRAAILGQKGGVWAKSSGFEIPVAEQTAILNIFSNPENAQATGARIAGVKYFALQVTPQSFYGKKAADGCVIRKTKQAVIVTVYDAPVQAQECTSTVESLGDYLESVGY